MDKEVLNKISIIIPSLNPDEKLCKTVSSLLNIGFADIICVNDGSREDCICFFPQESNSITILTHEVNRGKGAALKTAFSYIVENRHDSIGAITVDGDGQHSAKDVLKCAEALIKEKDNIILGCRDFSEPQVPARSKFGNKITSAVFKLFCGLKISDTQTGLRAFPAKYYSDMLEISGNRFEYETNMLLEMKARKIPFTEVKIETVYIEENRTSHFRPFKDSFRIYSLIFKFSFGQFVKFLISSVFSSFLDGVLLFCFLKLMFFTFSNVNVAILTFISCILGRTISSLFNFWINRKSVFSSKLPLKSTLLKYYCIAAPLGIIYAILTSLSSLATIQGYIPVEDTSLAITLLGYAVNCILFIASFLLQKRWVFNKK